MKKNFFHFKIIYFFLCGYCHLHAQEDSKIQNISGLMVDQYGQYLLLETADEGYGKRKVTLWDLELKDTIGVVYKSKSGEFTPNFKLSFWNNSPYFQSVKLSKKGDKHILQVFDLASNDNKEYDLPFRYGTLFAFSPDRQHLAIQNDTNVYIMNLYPAGLDTSGQYFNRLAPAFTDTLHNGLLFQPRLGETYLYSIKYSPDGQYVVLPIEVKDKKSDDTGIIFIDTYSGKSITLKKGGADDKYEKAYTKNVAFSDSKYVALNYGDKKILLYDALSLSYLRTIDVSTNVFKESIKRSEGNVLWRSDLSFSSRKVSSMTFSPDQKYLYVTYSDDLLISVFNIESGEEVYLFGRENCGGAFLKIWFNDNNFYALSSVSDRGLTSEQLKAQGLDPQTVEKCSGLFIYNYDQLKSKF
jgi:WD40 repeat protein